MEQKSLTVKFLKDVFQIGEKSKLTQLSVGIEVQLVKWFLTMLKGLLLDV